MNIINLRKSIFSMQCLNDIGFGNRNMENTSMSNLICVYFALKSFLRFLKISILTLSKTFVSVSHFRDFRFCIFYVYHFAPYMLKAKNTTIMLKGCTCSFKNTTSVWKNTNNNPFNKIPFPKLLLSILVFSSHIHIMINIRQILIKNIHFFNFIK